MRAVVASSSPSRTMPEGPVCPASLLTIPRPPINTSGESDRTGLLTGGSGLSLNGYEPAAGGALASVRVVDINIATERAPTR